MSLFQKWDVMYEAKNYCIFASWYEDFQTHKKLNDSIMNTHLHLSLQFQQLLTLCTIWNSWLSWWESAQCRTQVQSGLGRSPGEKATHSSILAGEFHRLYDPWGRQESRHDWVIFTYCIYSTLFIYLFIFLLHLFIYIYFKFIYIYFSIFEEVARTSLSGPAVKTLGFHCRAP